MDPQSIFLPAKRRIGRKRKSGAVQTVAPLTLVLATYEDINPSVLSLTFDRDIDVTALDWTAIVVNDQPNTGQRWQGTDEFSQPDDATVRITLIATGPATPGPLTMSASAGNGIVARDDGAAWAGASNLELPFP
jgi:hypothetical protein